MKHCIAILMVCVLGLALGTATDGIGFPPGSDYFDHIKLLVQNLNAFRTNINSLTTYTQMQLDNRLVNYTSLSYEAGAFDVYQTNYTQSDLSAADSYMCWDDMSKLMNSPMSRSQNYCGKRGNYPDGTSYLTNIQASFPTSNLPSFEWSDTLALSAQKYLQAMDGCDQYWRQIVYDESPLRYITELTSYIGDHKRWVFYPEKFNWSNEKETVWDWITDSQSPDWMNYLLGTHFDSVGIACNCHKNFGEVCVVELGRNVVPDYSLEHEHVTTFGLESYRNLHSTEWEELPGLWGDRALPNWWLNTEQQEEWLMDNWDNTHKLMLEQFKLAHDPTCADDWRNHGFCEIDDDDNNDNADQSYTQKGFGNWIRFMINSMRTSPDPSVWLDQFDALQANNTHYNIRQEKRDFIYQLFDEGSDEDLVWSETMFRSLIHVLNIEGSCGTAGDFHSDYVSEVLRKYYAHQVIGFNLLHITLSLDDINLTTGSEVGNDAIKVVASVFRDNKEEDLANFFTHQNYFAAACSCSTEDVAGFESLQCVLATADDITPRLLVEGIPLEQDYTDVLSNGCAAQCPTSSMEYMSMWENTGCEMFPDLPNTEINGVCQPIWDTVPRCVSSDDTECLICMDDDLYPYPAVNGLCEERDCEIWNGESCDQCAVVGMLTTGLIDASGNLAFSSTSDFDVGSITTASDVTTYNGEFSEKWGAYLAQSTDFTYIPRNIFLNPMTGHCTQNCSDDYHLYENPIAYNFEDWDLLYHYIFNGVSQVSLRQFELPHDDTPLTCQCLPGHEMLADGSCLDCSSRFGYGCSSCSETECLSCSSNKKMLATDGLSCVDKLVGCTVRFEFQPEQLLINPDGEYVCPKCKTGYFWNKHELRCTPCDHSIEHCTECFTAERCIDCRNGFFPSYDQTYCQAPIENCNVSHWQKLSNNGEHYVCQTCDDGYYTDGPGCTKCNIPGCDRCVSATECVSCMLPQIETPDGNSNDCQDPLPNCNATTDEYLVQTSSWTSQDEFVCPNCNENYLWSNSQEWNCLPCGQVIDNCTRCKHGKCYECETGYDLAFDQMSCLDPIPNCNATSTPSDYIVIGGNYHCKECNEGYSWDATTRQCKPCNDFFNPADLTTDCNRCTQWFATKQHKCLECDGDSILNFWGTGCVPRIQNCDVPVKDQPAGLYLTEDKTGYQCDCLPGFFWNDDSNQCVECEIEHCTECSDATHCLECIHSWYDEEGVYWEFMLNPISTRCVYKKNFCNAKKEDQPNGLEVWETDDDSEEPFWYCDDCEDGWYTGSLDQMFECQSCAEMENCEVCASADLCLECSRGLVPNGNKCEVEDIPNCRVQNEDNAMECDECHDYYQLTEDRRQCVPCNLENPGCIECSLADDNTVEECHTCATNMNLFQGECIWLECADIQTTDKYHNPLEYASCQDCADGYGYDSATGLCVECVKVGEFWSDCSDCSIDANHEPFNCLACEQGTLFEVNDGVQPVNRCNFVVLENCATRSTSNSSYCDECMPGYWWDGINCQSCEISGCQTCRQDYIDDTTFFNSCVDCGEGKTARLNVLNLDGTDYLQAVCDWVREIDHCTVPDNDDPTNCLQCNDHYYFNGLTDECELCDTVLDGCSMCDHEATACETCLYGYSLDSDNLCWRSNCETLDTDGETCLTCNRGWLNLDGVCVQDCGDTHTADHDNRVCRVNCEVGQYPDPADVNNCLACTDVVTYCETCGPQDGVISDTQTTICFDCQAPLFLTGDVGSQVCEHQNCATIDTTDASKCSECDAGYYITWDTTACIAENAEDPSITCGTDYITYSISNQDDVDYCGPICSEGEYVISADKSCGTCSDEITDCNSCQEVEGTVNCLACAYDQTNSIQLMPTYDGLACTSCAANEWDNEGTCTLCSDGGVDHCGRCGIDGACLACYNNLIVTDDGSGVVTECTCAGTQFLSVPDEDVEGTQCVPCNNVLQGGIEDCILCELDTDTNLPVCTECIDPLFVSVTDGTCTSEACGEIVDGECVTCNTRDNLVFYTQQNTCVLNCEDPYTLVEVDGASTCTVDCPSGQYSLGTTCNECVASDCHRCIESGECIHCNFGTSCEIDCSSNTMLTIYDYETDNQEMRIRVFSLELCRFLPPKLWIQHSQMQILY